jgi:ORF6N domain
MLSTHLADLYGVEPRALIQAVRRNMERFPKDCMFQLTQGEWHNLKSQIVISSWGGLRRATPYAFTEHGALMATNVLNSTQAVKMSVLVVRTFVRMRPFLNPLNGLNGAKRLNDWNGWNGWNGLEKKYDAQFKVVFDAIRELMAPPTPKRRKIGFLVEEKAAAYGRR